MYDKSATSSPQETSDDIAMYLQYLFQSQVSLSSPYYSPGFAVPFGIPNYPFPTYGFSPANVNANANASSSPLELTDSDTDEYDTESESENESEVSGTTTEETLANSNPSRSPQKRNRPPVVKKLRRRSRLDEKVKELRQLIPNTSELDKADVLDEAIVYLKDLQYRVKMVSMSSGISFYPFVPGSGRPRIDYSNSFGIQHGSYHFPIHPRDYWGEGSVTDIDSIGSNSFASETETEASGSVDLSGSSSTDDGST